MKKFKACFVPALLCVLLAALALAETQGDAPAAKAPAGPAGERRLRNLRQLTFGGENAEAYFSSDGRQLIFQSKRDGRELRQRAETASALHNG